MYALLCQAAFAAHGKPPAAVPGGRKRRNQAERARDEERARLLNVEGVDVARLIDDDEAEDAAAAAPPGGGGGAPSPENKQRPGPPPAFPVIVAAWLDRKFGVKSVVRQNALDFVAELEARSRACAIFFLACQCGMARYR